MYLSPNIFQSIPIETAHRFAEYLPGNFVVSVILIITELCYVTKTKMQNLLEKGDPLQRGNSFLSYAFLAGVKIPSVALLAQKHKTQCATYSQSSDCLDKCPKMH